MVYRSGPRWSTLQRLEKDLPISFEPEDYSEMSSHRSKRTLRNGYSHHSSLSLTTLECHAQLVTTAQSHQTESSTMRWGKCQKLQHNSASVRDRLRECGFVTTLRQTQTPLPSRKCALELPTQFIGQRNCGVPVCMVDQQSSSVTESPPPGQTEANQHTFDKLHRLNSNCRTNLEPHSVENSKPQFLKSMGHVVEDGPRSMHEVIFSTEVPQSATLQRHKGNSESGYKGQDFKHMSNTRGQGLSREDCVSSLQRTVLRDQIHRVVVNLEEVLFGLKEVHLEMKEVVQQIDKLTSNIDLGEEDTSGGSSSSSKVPASEDEPMHTNIGIHPVRDFPGHPKSPSCNPSTVPRANKRLQAFSKDQPERRNAPRLPPPAYPTGHSGTNSLVPKSDHNTTVPGGKGAKSETAKAPRSQKPPPYPSSRAGRANKEKDPGLKSHPYSGKRKLLSTTV